MKVGKHNEPDNRSRWRQIKTHYLILAAGAGAAATAATLFAGGAFDSRTAVNSMRPDTTGFTIPVDKPNPEALVYYLVNSQAQVDGLSLSFTDDQAARSSILVVDSLEAESAASGLTSAAWGSSLAANLHVVDLRSSAVVASTFATIDPEAAGQVSIFEQAAQAQRKAVHYLVGSRIEADLLHHSVTVDQLLLDAASLPGDAYTFHIIDSPEAEQQAAELIAGAENEPAEPGWTVQVVDRVEIARNPSYWRGLAKRQPFGTYLK